MVIEANPTTTMSIPVPSIITSSPSGGRFDFDDGGTYCGGWQDGKAHGHGVCTGPKNVGEYSGSWNFGFEMSGVYKWKNGAVYEGRWQNGKRHGVGVEYNGKWIYRGEWSQGYKGRYGVKASSNSAVKYEGTWANGLQDGYGSETYSDGGYYQGQMCRGLRHGYGVRKSAPYGDSQLNNPNKNGVQVTTSTGLSNSTLIHSNSLQSAASVDLEDDSPKPEDGFKPNIDRTLASKNGFVLVAKPLDVPMPASSKYHSQATEQAAGKSGARRNSLTNRLAASRIPGSNQTASLLRGLRLRKQKSTSDLDTIAARQTQGRASQTGAAAAANDDLPAVPFTLSPEELDITDPNTVETYTGEWKHDKRNGHGICERSDGLKYEGQWHNDMKCGYGVTTFKNGTKEEGKYRNNILVADSKVKRFFQLGAANIRQRIDDAAKMANQAQAMAMKKAEIADTRAATARDKADQASTAAVEADRDSQIAFSVARQYSEPQQQLGMQMMSMMGQGQSQQQQVAGASPLAANPHFSASMGEPALPNLGLSSSALQMRRISQQQPNQFAHAGYSDHLADPRQQQQQHQQNMVSMSQMQQLTDMNHQYSGPAEPFNGRRGSFRSGSQPSSGYQSAFQGPQGKYNPAGAGAASQAARTQSSDPFSDLFDHYKSAPSHGAAGRRAGLSKQTSLDCSRGTSVPRQFPAQATSEEQQQQPGGLSRLQRFRMSSMDHAEENHSRISQVTANSDQQRTAADNNMQQQLRHLVTSSEDLKQQQQRQQAPTSATQADLVNLSSTPTGSSYILPHSANSSFYGNQTPSPEGQQQYYGQQQVAMAPQPGAAMPRYLMKQRDVHSLADEQLYMAGRRKFQDDPLQRSEYANYDFAISSMPRPAERYMRRSASLSRNTPASAADLRGLANGDGSAPLASTQLHPSSRTLKTAASGGAGNRGSPASLGADQHHHFHTKSSSASAKSNHVSARFRQANTEASATIANHHNDCMVTDSPLPPSNSSHLSVDSTGSSSGALIRKPSLQVRYDPQELGGLMTREEVAALSHAQREQKRLELEMAEKRAKKPLLHVYLALKDFLYRQRLLISVLVMNTFLFKLFADLIV